MEHARFETARTLGLTPTNADDILLLETSEHSGNNPPHVVQEQIRTGQRIHVVNLPKSEFLAPGSSPENTYVKAWTTGLLATRLGNRKQDLPLWFIHGAPLYAADQASIVFAQTFARVFEGSPPPSLSAKDPISASRSGAMAFDRIRSSHGPSRLKQWFTSIVDGGMTFSCATNLYLREDLQTLETGYRKHVWAYLNSMGAGHIDLLQTARCLRKLNQSEKALQLLENPLSLSLRSLTETFVHPPLFSNFLRLEISLCHFELGNLQTAKIQFEKLLQDHDPTFPYSALIRLHLAQIERTQKHPIQAMHQCLLLLEENPQSPHYAEATLLLARIYRELGQHQKSIRLLQQMREEHPEQFDSSANLLEAKIHMDLGEFAESKRILNSWSQESPPDTLSEMKNCAREIDSQLESPLSRIRTEQVLRWIEDLDSEHHAEISARFLRIGPPIAPILRGQFRRLDSDRIRQRILKVLYRLDDPSTEQLALEGLRSNQPRLLRESIKILIFKGMKPNILLRQIRTLARQSTSSEIEQWTQELDQILVGTSPEIRRKLPNLLALIHSKNPTNRMEAIRILIQYDHPDIIPPLAHLLGDFDPEVRNMTLIALELHCDRRATEALVKSLSDPHPRRRAQSARLLGQLATPSILPSLTPLTQDPAFIVRRAALESIARIDLPEVREILIHHLCLPNSSIHPTCTWGLLSLPKDSTIASICGTLLKDQLLPTAEVRLIRLLETLIDRPIQWDIEWPQETKQSLIRKLLDWWKTSR
ncbi:MAG: HEAT repeat domain-containing protein [Planctomycetota bacterium]|nr:HEAT repeat domain-containing protein [Planctomycetota bacterium]